jgi:hypothetical protein
MLTEAERFITEMKLRELRRQRERLQSAYRQLEEKSETAPDDVTRLRLLYDGLREIKFADHPLHPDVANLDAVFHQIDSGHPLEENFLQFWLRRLRQELETGRSRSHFVYLFGTLLADWIQVAATESSFEPITVRQQLLSPLLEDKAIPESREFLTSLLLPFRNSEQQEWYRYDLKRVMDSGFTAQILKGIRDNIYRPAHLRQQASDFMENSLLLNEFSDALTIILDDLEQWQWPPASVPVYPVRVGAKWRLFLDEDLPTAAFLAVIGNRWITKYGYLLEERPPDERYYDPIWTPDGMKFANVEVLTFNEVSIRDERYKAHQAVEGAIWGVDYSEKGYSGGMELAVRLINAEMRLWQAAFPHQPFYVVKADLQDFYPSISHDLIDTLLELGGVTEMDRQLIQRILTIPLQGENSVEVAQRGLANDRTLSHALGESLLARLNQFIHQKAPVQIVRIIDDICILAATATHALDAWQAIHEFCQRTGLVVNEQKSGAVSIGGNLPAGLPNRLPTWKFLQLRPNGEWQVDQVALNEHLTITREEVRRAPSVIAAVEVYNQRVRELIDSLALNYALGQPHRYSADEAIAQFHHQFANGRSITTYLAEMIRAHLPEAGEANELPEAWFYWPLSAGGLGLLQPNVTVASYTQAYKQREKQQAKLVTEELPDDWQHKHNQWLRFYRHWLQELHPANPDSTQLMESLTKDFIQRGSQMSGQKQQTLSSYWRWVLYTYGPQIIERFGSFRFLITELVPLQFILERRRQVT